MASPHDFEELRDRMRDVVARSTLLHTESLEVLNDSARRLEESATMRDRRARAFAPPAPRRPGSAGGSRAPDPEGGDRPPGTRFRSQVLPTAVVPNISVWRATS